MIGQGVTFNYDCFNFFVLGGEEYEGAFFLVPKDRALTESTSQEMKDLCASLSPEAVAIIKTFPAIFCSENRHYSKTDPDHMAYYGYVTDIRVQDNGIKVYFTKLRLGITVLADKAYGKWELREFIANLGADFCIPPKSNESDPWYVDWWLYKERHLVEVFFLKLKEFRRVATRYDKLANRFLAFVHLACIRILLA